MANWLEGTGELSQEWNIAYIFFSKRIEEEDVELSGGGGGGGGSGEI